MTLPISHAVVLPDRDFEKWLAVVRPYMQAFERVAVVRSPAGNDLNRFRDITAVQAPLVWHNDDALDHIRRAYPMVVRVDIIHAYTPSQLAVVLQERIDTGDRYGEKQNNPRHIFDRFVLEWPTDARPTRIARGFSLDGQNPHEGLDIEAHNGARVLAAAPGMVTRVVRSGDSLGYGPYVQITTGIDGRTYVTTYGGLKDIEVNAGQQVKSGDSIASAAGEAIKLVVQDPGGGVKGMRLPDVVDPTLMIYWQQLRLRPSVGALRVRSHGGTYGTIIGLLHPTDEVETQEVHGRTLAKLGVEGQWLRIRRPGVPRAYTAAWYLEAYGLDDPPEAIPGISIPGVNLDLDHRLGVPPAAEISALGWVRLIFNVSLNPNFHDHRRYGNTDVNFTYRRYLPVLQQYANAGLKVILVLTHQTYGEGQGYVWTQMNRDRWRDLTRKYADLVREVAAQFAGRNLVHAYQIWNEQDTPPDKIRSAVPVPPAEYAHLLAEATRAIRSVDSQVYILTGGHAAGPDQGTVYARAALDALPAGLQPDGVAFHPYGRGPAGSPFSRFGSLNESIQAWARLLPDRPLWITEWGVLDRQGDNTIIGQVNQYATGFLNVIRRQFPGQVAAAIWYAWADSMDNGYGLVRSNGEPKQPLYDTFLKK
jgi:hypothetical protein